MKKKERNTAILIRLSKEEAARIDKAADIRGLATASFARMVLLEAAKELKQTP